MKITQGLLNKSDKFVNKYFCQGVSLIWKFLLLKIVFQGKQIKCRIEFTRIYVNLRKKSGESKRYCSYDWFHTFKFPGYSKPKADLFYFAWVLLTMSAHQGIRAKILMSIHIVIGYMAQKTLCNARLFSITKFPWHTSKYLSLPRKILTDRLKTVWIQIQKTQ